MQGSLGDVTREFDFDAVHRITRILDTSSPGSGLPANPGSPNWTFGYDGQDRLASSTNAATSGVHANLALDWRYDPTGNRTRETRNGTPVDYTIASDSNRLDAVGTTRRTYDSAGNTATDGTYAYTYNARNRLIQARLQSTNTVVARYAINAMGERVCKATAGGDCPRGPGIGAPTPGSGTFTQFAYDESGHLVGEYDQTGALVAEHVWLGDTPIAVLKPSSYTAIHGGTAAGNVAAFFVDPDHLDTTRVIRNASQVAVWRWNSTPFGDSDAEQSPTGLTEFGYALRFPGQYFDAETNSHYNYSRDYESGRGRYLQSDPLDLFGGGASFSYGANTPALHSDRLGLIVEPWQVGPFNQLKKLEEPWDGLEIHHVPQGAVAKGCCDPQYDYKTAPAIAVPTNVHGKLPRSKCAQWTGDCRNLMARDIWALRGQGAPRLALLDLLKLAKQKLVCLGKGK